MDAPKRRKHKDNPYTLTYIEEKNVFIVVFKDGTGKLKQVEVKEEIYKILDEFELEDIKEMNEYDRHIEHAEVYENTLKDRIMDKPISLEDEVIRQATFEELKRAIDMLPDLQKKRIKQYYFDDMSAYEIARIEGTAHQVVDRNIKKAIENLKKFLKI